MHRCISPAKLNLYLAVTGFRERDGFHELDSLVVLLDFGDVLSITHSPDSQDHFHCNHATLQWDESNLVFRALTLYRSLTGFSAPLEVHLEKRIPLGAGLGGGSSNASTLLKAVNTLNPHPLPLVALQEASAALGSDCPLFFAKGLMRMRGRGEQIESIDSPLLSELSGKRLLVFHPGFPISAAWAYQQLRKQHRPDYTQPKTADNEIQHWIRGGKPWLECPRNDLSTAVDRKFLAIPTLKHQLWEAFQTPIFMSGSGSACFALLDEATPKLELIHCIRTCWGRDAWINETSIKST